MQCSRAAKHNAELRDFIEATDARSVLRHVPKCKREAADASGAPCCDVEGLRAGLTGDEFVKQLANMFKHILPQGAHGGECGPSR